MTTYSQKKLFALTDAEIIHLHLNARNITATEDYLVRSTLPIVIGEARHAMNNKHSKDMLPCLGAFAALDQIGSVYFSTALPSYPHTNASGIKKALYYFAGFSPNGPETNALYLFRNGLVHDGSLVSHSSDGKHHQWASYDHSIPAAVQVPKTPWDGEEDTLTEDTVTWVNPQKLVELTEAVVSNVQSANSARTLRVIFPSGAKEIISRYLLLVPRATQA